MTVNASGAMSLALALIASSGAVAEEANPSDAFLEYLGEMVHQDGEWIDPLELDELPEDAVEDGAELADPITRKVAQPPEEQS